jgi:hypothetical protein
MNEFELDGDDFDGDEERIETGDEVRYMAEGGWPGEVESANTHLTAGAIYTVADACVHSWHTKLYLDGFPDIAFNSVLFDKVGDDV